jgi:hypothetical protein
MCQHNAAPSMMLIQSSLSQSKSFLLSLLSFYCGPELLPPPQLHRIKSREGGEENFFYSLYGRDDIRLIKDSHFFLFYGSILINLEMSFSFAPGIDREQIYFSPLMIFSLFFLSTSCL